MFVKRRGVFGLDSYRKDRVESRGGGEFKTVMNVWIL